MKRLLRSDGVQALLGWVLGTYLQIVLKTVRWTHENVACVEPVLAGDGGAIALFWHGRIPLSLATAPQWGRKPTRALVSPSADGEFIAKALAMSGFPAIRASSAKKGDSAKARAAVAAIREAVAWVSGGGALVVTPDGPRGAERGDRRRVPADRQAVGPAGVPHGPGGHPGLAAPEHLGPSDVRRPVRQRGGGLGRTALCAGGRRRRRHPGADRRLVGPAVGRHAPGRGDGGASALIAPPAGER
ncbi:DUF374 domain-containing protein [Phenylobacterium sp. J367]|uniref:DUF374 domain-containing protein n=1 Tax=Phenylobacterium sp. J367 TaxID=2898435 RepID=UPI002150AAF0|nr:DUF374 domain-containing protein [Phenylobacterium sp. J367]MCR5877503.1 DUF374 domain-containing protein [Phenylobacterium sp. J367]